MFCVFFSAPHGRLTAAVIDAAAGGLSRRLITPAGLSGWAWGELRLDDVTVRPCDVLGQPRGIGRCATTSACHRPLVAATALGAAAAVHNQIRQVCSPHGAKRASIARVRDNAASSP